MLFGMQKKPSPFGLGQTPPIHNPDQSMQVGMGHAQNGREPGTGIGALILGSVGDALLQHSGAQPVYAQNMAQRRELAMRSQQAAAERQAKWEDWKRQFDYEAANPKPVNNDTINDFNWYKGLSSQDQAIYDRMHPIVIDGPDGRYMVPRAAMGGQMMGGGMPAVGSVVADPRKAGGPQVPPAAPFRR